MQGKSANRTRIIDKFVWIGIGLGVLFWILESTIHVFVFRQGNLAVQLLTPGLHAIWMRSLVASLLIMFGVYAQFIINRCKRVEEALRKAHDDLERRIEKRTGELAKANEQLKREMDERERTEKALRESEGKYRMLVESAGAPMTYWSLDGTLLLINAAGAKNLGGTPDDFVGKSIYEILPDMADITMERTRQIVESGTGSDFEDLIALPSGKRWFNSSFQPMRDASGEVSSLQIVSQDISSRKQVEEALRESEERYRNIFAESPIGIEHYDLGDKLLEVNNAYLKIFGAIDQDEIKGFNLFADPNMSQEVKAKLRNGETVRYQFHFDFEKVKEHRLYQTTKSGKSFLDVLIQPLGYREGIAHNGYLVQVLDITERQRTEEALRESEERYRAVFEGAAEGILVADLETKKFKYANPALCKMLGYTEEELKQMSVHDLHPKEALEHVISEFEAQARGEKTLAPSIPCLKEDGTTMYADINTAKALIDRRECNVGFFTDVTERKRAEEYIHTLSQQLIKAQESERQRISSDLHDNLAQDLSSLKIGLDTLLDNQSEVPAEMRQRVSELSKMLQGVIMAVRNLAYDLRPAGLDQLGLVRTVHQHCEEFSDRSGLKVDFFAGGIDDSRVGFDTKISLYRLIQESLNNVKKHADASQVTIRLLASFPNIILRIEDNGKGFDVEDRLVSAANERRMGLRTMEETVALLQGKMRIESRPMQGTKIFIEVPWKGK